MYKKFLPITTSKDVKKVYLEQINYICKKGRKLCIHMDDGNIIECYSSFGVLFTWLDDSFYVCHNSLIVNLANIVSVSNQNLSFENNDSLRLGIVNWRHTRNSYKNYLEKKYLTEKKYKNHI